MGVSFIKVYIEEETDVKFQVEDWACHQDRVKTVHCRCVRLFGGRVVEFETVCLVRLANGDDTRQVNYYFQCLTLLLYSFTRRYLLRQIQYLVKTNTLSS